MLILKTNQIKFKQLIQQVKMNIDKDRSIGNKDDCIISILDQIFENPKTMDDINTDNFAFTDLKLLSK